MQWVKKEVTYHLVCTKSREINKTVLSFDIYNNISKIVDELKRLTSPIDFSCLLRKFKSTFANIQTI